MFNDSYFIVRPVPVFFLRRRYTAGFTLIELLVWLSLIMVGFTLTFEVLSRYLWHHQRTLGQTRQASEIIRLRDFFTIHLRDGHKGVGLRTRGGGVPLARQDNQPVSSIWISHQGKTLNWLERQSEVPLGTVVYTRLRSDGFEWLVSGTPGATRRQVALAMVVGLPLPESLSALWGEQISLPVFPYHGPRCAWVGEVVSIRPAQPGDLTSADIGAGSLVEQLKWSDCQWWEVRQTALESLSPLVSLDTLGRQLRQREEGLTYRVIPLVGWRQLECRPDGSLVSLLHTSGSNPENMVLFPPETLLPNAQFRYITPDLSESVSPPPLYLQSGISFSAHCHFDGRRLLQRLYFPVIVEEWLRHEP